MILNKRYKVIWKHFNNTKAALTYMELNKEVKDILRMSDNKTKALSDIEDLFLKQRDISLNVLTQSHSLCNIIDLDSDTEKIVNGISLVHPNDQFNRKKGVRESFKDAVNKFEGKENKELRTEFWKLFFKLREYTPPKLLLSRGDALIDFLKSNTTKRVEGNYIKYTIIQNTELWFKREN